MKTERIFSYRSLPTNATQFVLQIDYDKFHLEKTSGSYQVIVARLLGLSWVQFLKLCRDIFHAEIRGKNSLYPLPVFNGKEDLEKLIKLLNAQASLILFNRVHPEYDTHKEALDASDV